MNNYHAVAASSEVYGLAEGPFWDGDRQRLLWVDINAGNVHIGDLGDGQIISRERLTFPGTVGAVVCSARGDLLVAGARTLHTVSPSGVVAAGVRLIPSEKASRLNDGACDPAGRFLVGSLALDDRQHDEVLARIEESGSVTVIDDDLDLSNGLAWSPDGTVLYSIDTIPGRIWQRGYDAASGSAGDRHEFLHLRGVSPDGMCVDADGNLWIAIFGGGQVRCYTPNGEQIATIHVAAPNTSSVAFAGPDLDTLVITTASEQLSAAQLAEYPDSGRLFTCRPGARGLPSATWVGP